MIVINGHLVEVCDKRPGDHNRSELKSSQHWHQIRSSLRSYEGSTQITDEERQALATDDESTNVYDQAIASVERVKREVRALKDRQTGYDRGKVSGEL